MLTPSRSLRDAIRRRTPDRVARWLVDTIRSQQHRSRMAAFPPPAAPGDVTASVATLLAHLGETRGVLVLRQTDHDATLGIARTDLPTLWADLAARAPGVRLFPDAAPRPAHTAPAHTKSAELLFTDAAGRPVTVTLELYAPDAMRRWQSARVMPIALRACEAEVFTRSGTKTLAEVLGAPTLDDLAAAAPIDAVLTWVDHADPGWQRLYAEATGTQAQGSDATALSRFRNNDELRYALRSLDSFAPWLRRIHIVTNCAAPDWLDPAHPRIAWVDHAAVIPAEVLPTFNSHVIESCLHRVPDLARRFIYLNDDVFVMRAMRPADFFSGAGLTLARLESFGVVSGEVDPAHPDYLNAARNSAALIRDALGFWPTRLHQHVPFALDRDILAEMETRWAEDYARFRRNRFRDRTDLNVTSFLYHHYAIGTGRAAVDPREAVLIKSNDPETQDRRFRRAMTEPLDFACINEGGTAAPPPGWAAKTRALLMAKFPRAAPWEQ